MRCIDPGPRSVSYPCLELLRLNNGPKLELSLSTCDVVGCRLQGEVIGNNPDKSSRAFRNINNGARRNKLTGCVNIVVDGESVIVPHDFRVINSATGGLLISITNDWPSTVRFGTGDFTLCNKYCNVKLGPNCQVLVDYVQLTIAAYNRVQIPISHLALQIVTRDKILDLLKS